MRRALAAASLLALVSAHPASASSDADQQDVTEPEAEPDNPLVDCIIQVESQGNPNATNPRSHAAGLGQFLASTWLTTPQGRAGYSVYNAAANRAAVIWMVNVGRAMEFVAVSGGYCW